MLHEVAPPNEGEAEDGADEGDDRGDEPDLVESGDEGVAGHGALAVLYQRSQCTIVSSGLRAAGLKSVPMVYAVGISAACMISS